MISLRSLSMRLKAVCRNEFPEYAAGKNAAAAEQKADDVSSVEVKQNETGDSDNSNTDDVSEGKEE